MKNVFVCFFLCFVILICSYSLVAQSQWIDPNQGRYKVGFKTIVEKDKNQKPLLISLWFPATVSGNEISIWNLMKAQRLKNEDDSTLVSNCKSILRMIYDLESIDSSKLYSSFSSGVKAYQNARIKDGKLPLVIAQSDPTSHYYQFQFLASHGFIVASISSVHQSYPLDSNHYKAFVDELEWLLNYMSAQPYVDTSRISAFGHGGGIQAAAYLAMRTPGIKKVVNLDGGFFSPRSKTTISSDYHPQNLKVPFLHIITQGERREDDEAQIRVLKNPIFRVTIKTDLVWHHDFTSFGRIAGEGLKIRKPFELINEVVNACDTLVLQFLSGHIITNEKEAFDIEKIN